MIWEALEMLWKASGRPGKRVGRPTRRTTFPDPGLPGLPLGSRGAPAELETERRGGVGPGRGGVCNNHMRVVLCGLAP